MLIRDIVHSSKFLPTPEDGPLSDNTTYLGVEVETEGSELELHNVDPDYWRLTQDGSLKSEYPWEFIFSQPLAGKQVVDALTELEDTLDDTPVEYPINTSVHVHMNVGDLDRAQLRNLVYLCVVVEAALVYYSGNRTDSCFCIPWGAVDPRILQDLGWFLENRTSEASLPKYTTVNFNSVFKLGTIEFRTHEGTHSKQRILEWIEVLLALKRYAIKTADDPRSRLDYQTTQKNLTKFLGDIWEPRVVRRMLHPGLHDQMRRSSLTARLALFPKTHTEIRQFVTGRENTVLDALSALDVIQPSTQWTQQFATAEEA